MFVIKDGMIHRCDTQERYESFIESGWKPYKPEAITKTKKQTKAKK